MNGIMALRQGWGVWSYVTRFTQVAVGVLAVTVMAFSADADEPVLGLESVDEPLPWFDAELNYPEYDRDERAYMPDRVPAVTSLGRPPMDEPLEVALSRDRYPAEDGHLDVILRFDRPLDDPPAGALRVRLADAEGETLSGATIEAIPGSQVYFSYRFPTSLHGGRGQIEVTWLDDDGDTLARDAAGFRVSEPASVESSGRVRLTVPNETGATLRAAPMTAGVPFPRGVLDDTSALRLVDAEGNEIPLQVKETARWSRFGSIRWVMCDFTADLDGESRTFYLEYGPKIARQQDDQIEVELRDGALPRIRAGRVRIDDDGIAYDITGQGDYRVMLDAEALRGAFVRDVRGANYEGRGHNWMSSRGHLYRMPVDTRFEIEEIGPTKLVLRAEGWYVDPERDQRYCRFVNRYVIHRDSPVVRLFHTWVFTGDSNRDRIRNMGWRFALNDMEPMGFLTDFSEEPRWLEGYYLRQHDHEEFALFEYEEPRRTRRVTDDMLPERPITEIETGHRASGVMAAEGEDTRLYIGVRDFWRNFPGSLRMTDGLLEFNQWPRYGRERQHAIDIDNRGELFRLWFAHEGESLSFALPMQLLERPLYPLWATTEPFASHGMPESVNAQGIAKTAEMWLYLTGTDVEPAEAVRTLEGLDTESIRAVVDPVWMTGSGAFYETGPADASKHPDYERAYDQSVRSPLVQIERMGVYGKWIYGDVLRTARLDERDAPGLHRVFRKAHWGWPYSWTPFVRSGDTELLRFAQAATRMMSDVAFVHYVSDEVEDHFDNLPKRLIWDERPLYRRIGWHNRNLIPWAGYWGPTARLYVDQADYLWDAWHVSGYHRARDVALAWAEQTKIEEPGRLDEELIGRGAINASYNRARWPTNLLKQYTEMYQQTWDPWFITAAHAIAEMHLWRLDEQDWTGHFWLAGNETYQRYTASESYERFYRRHLESQGDWHAQGWARQASTLIPAAVFGYEVTGDDYYLRRAAGILDLARWGVYDDPDDDSYYQGFFARSSTNRHMNFTSWFQLWGPWVIGAFERAGGAPEHPLPVAFEQRLGDETRIAVRKASDESLTLRTQGDYTIHDAEGETVMEGSADEVTIDGSHPPGTYYVDLGGRTVMQPISPPDTEEVIVLGEDETVGTARRYAQHWFFVPEDVREFTIELDNTEPFRQDVRQIIIWNPAGEEVWAHRERTIDHDPDREVIRAEVAVPSEHAGRLWRLTLPGERSMPFRLDGRLPQTLTHSPDRWFEP